MNKKTRLDLRLTNLELRERAMTVAHVGQEILNDSTQKRIDSKTIVLIRKKHQWDENYSKNKTKKEDKT